MNQRRTGPSRYVGEDALSGALSPRLGLFGTVSQHHGLKPADRGSKPGCLLFGRETFATFLEDLPLRSATFRASPVNCIGRAGWCGTPGRSWRVAGAGGGAMAAKRRGSRDPEIEVLRRVRTTTFQRRQNAAMLSSAG